MPRRVPKWRQSIGKTETTRSRSGKQESKIANSLKGRTTVNSGATFGENDVNNEFASVEAKITSKASYSLKLSEWEQTVNRTDTDKMPMMVIEFERAVNGKTLAVIDFDDLLHLIKMAEK